MSERKTYHVVYSKQLKRKFSRWLVKIPGTGEVIGSFFFKFFAIRYAQLVAKMNMPSSIMIHKKNGEFQDERTYGNDPFPPVG